jgi:hypothetical protein
MFYIVFLWGLLKMMLNDDTFKSLKDIFKNTQQTTPKQQNVRQNKAYIPINCLHCACFCDGQLRLYDEYCLRKLSNYNHVSVTEITLQLKQLLRNVG